MGRGVRFSVQRSGPGLVATLERIRKAVKDSSVKVGVFGTAKHQNGENDGKWAIGVVELAVIHEYGAPNAHIPARSFIGSTIGIYRRHYAQLAAEMLGRVYEGKLTVERALNLLGSQVANDIKRRIEQGLIKQDLAPSTLAAKLRKGLHNRRSKAAAAGASPKALIDTGLLKNSITYEVEGNGHEAGGGE
jgi:hypothetical protein